MVPETPELNQLRCPLHQTRPPPSAADHPHRSEFQVSPLSQSIRLVPTSPPMVDPQGQPGSPHPYVCSSSSHDSLDGCFENRMGGGVSSNSTTARGLWTQEEALLHINSLECLAVTRSLHSLSPPPNSVILIRSDNTVVVSLINKQGPTKAGTCHIFYKTSSPFATLTPGPSEPIICRVT